MLEVICAGVSFDIDERIYTGFCKVLTVLRWILLLQICRGRQAPRDTPPISVRIRVPSSVWTSVRSWWTAATPAILSSASPETPATAVAAVRPPNIIRVSTKFDRTMSVEDSIQWIYVAIGRLNHKEHGTLAWKLLSAAEVVIDDQEYKWDDGWRRCRVTEFVRGETPVSGG